MSPGSLQLAPGIQEERAHSYYRLVVLLTRALAGCSLGHDVIAIAHIAQGHRNFGTWDSSRLPASSDRTYAAFMGLLKTHTY